MNNENRGHQILADVIMFILKHDKFTGNDIINRFRVSPNTVGAAIHSFRMEGITRPMEDGSDSVIPKSIEELNGAMVEFLNEQGYDNEDIEDCFISLPTEEKLEISHILTDNHEWIASNIIQPTIAIPTILRLVNKNDIIYQNNREVRYAEDMKVGQWDGEKWNILPPYPKYDYSPLSHMSEISEGVEVTHIADITIEELDAWTSRTDRVYDYSMKIKIDPKYEEDVYHSLMWGSAYISRLINQAATKDEFDRLNKVYEILCDMQACIDQDDSNIKTVPDPRFVEIADYVVKYGCTESTNGTCNFGFEDIKHIIKNENDYNEFYLDIVTELMDREEISDVHMNHMNGTIDCDLHLEYCKSYEWTDGDENIFCCSREEWEKIKIKPFTLRGKNNAMD